ncbi:MAG: type 4a pilus biogenesis protein PilO [Candidatus Omnitrophica bacterium]|nr:type 4a pilus biogenesis protein PilO [Candidatus Omnitrophota bacterium]
MKKLDVKLAKSKRERALISVLIIILIAGGYFHIFLRPAIKKLVTLIPEVASLKNDLQDARFLMGQKASIDGQNKKLLLMMDEYQKIFPRQQEIQKILEDLSNIANESDVKIVGIRPFSEKGIGTKIVDIYKEIPVEIVARSGYHELGEFLQRLETGGRFIIVKDFKIDSNPHNVKKQNTRLIASTYVSITK